MEVQKLRKVIRAKRFEWRKHALARLLERGIPQEAVLEVLLIGEIIEDYLYDRPYPSALFLGWWEGKPLHVVVALDGENEWAYIITAYEPSLDEFEPDFRTRRRTP